ncbi:MAG: flagellar motor protein MotB [Pseudomonadota bacterium]
MPRDNSGNVTIIKRKKVIEGGHHGGAWKVAYADFVTAMMAFFLLMWLLNASDEVTRQGLAQYFSPTIPVHDMAGGGDGVFDGSSLFSEHSLAQNESGEAGGPQTSADEDSESDTLFDIEQQLLGASGDATEADPMLAHIATRLTDEGLIIEVFDRPTSPLFNAATTEFNPIFERLVQMIGRVTATVGNKVAISGHLATGDVALSTPSPDPWLLSSDRAQLTRELLVLGGVSDARIERVTGRSDRAPVISEDSGDPRNRRIEITLLREF